MTTPSQPTIQKYLKADLFEELSLDAMTPEERISFLEAFGNIVWQRVVLRAAKEFSDDEKENLEKILSTTPPDPQATGDFLKSLPQFEQIVEEEVAHYKKELIDRFKA